MTTNDRRPRRGKVLLAGGVVAVVAASAGTWALATRARTPAQLAARAKAPTPSRITVAVHHDRLAKTVELSCRGVPSRVTKVAAPHPADGVPEVTRVPLAKGDTVREGAVVVGVAGRPVIAIRGDLPPYRDLVVGDRGPDVVELQNALIRLGDLAAGHDAGHYDSSTVRAVRRLYSAVGYSAPRPGRTDSAPGGHGKDADTRHHQAGRSVPAAELLAVRRLPARIGKLRVRRGDTLRDGQITIVGGATKVRCTGDSGVRYRFRHHAPARLTKPDGKSTHAVVASVSTVHSTGKHGGGSTDRPGGGSRQVVALRVDGDRLPVGHGYRAKVIKRRAAHAGPVVPASAVYSRPNGHVVVKLVRAGRVIEVRVDPVLDVDGRVQVRPTGGQRLHSGDRVVVSGRNAGPA